MTIYSLNQIPSRDTKGSSPSQRRTALRKSRTMPQLSESGQKSSMLDLELESSSISSETGQSTMSMKANESELSTRTTFMQSVNKVYAAFLKNTIDPMLDKVKAILELAATKDIPITRDNISELLEKVFIMHACVLVIEWFFRLLVTAAVCYTVIKVL